MKTIGWAALWLLMATPLWAAQGNIEVTSGTATAQRLPLNVGAVLVRIAWLTDWGGATNGTLTVRLNARGTDPTPRGILQAIVARPNSGAEAPTAGYRVRLSDEYGTLLTFDGPTTGSVLRWVPSGVAVAVDGTTSSLAGSLFVGGSLRLDVTDTSSSTGGLLDLYIAPR